MQSSSLIYGEVLKNYVSDIFIFNSSKKILVLFGCLYLCLIYISICKQIIIVIRYLVIFICYIYCDTMLLFFLCILLIIHIYHMLSLCTLLFRINVFNSLLINLLFVIIFLIIVYKIIFY